MSENMKIVIGGDASGAKRALGEVSKSAEHNMAKIVAAVAAVTAGFQSFDKLIEVNRRFEVINASLVTVTGSVKSANRAFSHIQNFAATTPFQLDEVSNAFIKLKALGLDPSEHAMRSYGDTSAAMGKSLNQMIEAVADASTGEFERLKEFGIKARQQGDQVSFTFRGVTTTVEKNSADIQQYLLNIGDTDFAGAMALRADTLDGALSNLTDSWDNLFLVIGKSGATTIMKDMAVYFADAAKGASKLIQVLSNADDQSALAIQITDTQEKIKRLKKSVQDYNNQKFHPFESVFGNPNEDTFAALQKYEDQLKSLVNRRNDLLATPADNAGQDISKAGGSNNDKPKNGSDKVVSLAAKRAARELEINQNKLNRLMEQQAAYNEQLGMSAQLAFADEAQREDIRFQDKLTKIQEHFDLITENKLATDEMKLEAKSVYLEQVASLEEIHSARIIEMKQREADAIQSADETAAKNKLKLVKYSTGTELQMAASFMGNMAKLGGKNFEQNKKIQMAIAGVKGIGTVMNAIEHGSQTGGIYGAVIEGALAGVAVAAQLTAISNTSYGGGAVSVAPPSASSGTSSVPSFKAPSIPQSQQQQSQQQQQAPQVSIIVQALHPDAISPDTVQMIADGLSPALNDSFGRGQHLAVQAA